MEKKKVIKLNKIIQQTTSESDFGTQLELLAANNIGEEIDIGLYPLCRFVSDKKNVVLFEIYDNNNIVRFPIDELENAIDMAKKWVQSEESFDGL